MSRMTKVRWLLVALVASLALNLTLVGFLVGASGGPPPWRMVGFDATAGLGRLIRFLPDERRTDVFGDTDMRREIRRSLRTMRRAQHKIAEAMAAEPFDRDRLAAALEDFRTQFGANQQRSHAAFVSIMENLTPGERRQFVESTRHMRDPHRHRNRHRDGRRRDDGARDAGGSVKTRSE